MKPADRVDLITRCASTLNGRGWPEIDFILGQFNLPTQDDWRDSSDDREFNYVRHMLGMRHNEDRDLIALDDYLHAVPTHDEDSEPWQTGTICRVFITHLAAHKATAMAIRNQLRWWGLDGFVAHKDIEPGAEWVRVIVAALHSCDALIALLHDGFKDSNWCDQEVGVAFGRAVPVVPVKVDMDPYGFLGMFQAITWPKHGTAESMVVKDVIRILLANKRTADRAVEAIVKQLEAAGSFDQANTLSTTLAQSPITIDGDQLTRLRVAQKENGQLSKAYFVDDALTKLESRLSKPSTKDHASEETPPAYDYGPEPF